MNFGAHAFVWEGEWNNKSDERVIAEVSKSGLQLVEVPLLHPESFDAGRTRKLLAQYGIEAAYSLGLPLEARLPEYPDKAETFLRQALDAVATAGGKVLTGVVYASLGGTAGRPPTTKDYEIIARVLSSTAKYAAAKGIRIGIEPVNRYETFLLNTAEQAMDLLNRIGEDNVFIHLDTYHLNIEERSYSEAIRLCGDKIDYIHLSESHRGTPGTGTVNWDDVFAGLSAVGFTGALVMESFVKLNPDIKRATCMWRDIVGDSETLIRDGLTFLQKKAKEHGLS